MRVWAARLPSVLGSVAGIGLAALLARELCPRPRAETLAALLLALAPLDIFYAQEARSYALQGAALGLTLLAFARFLRQPANSGALLTYGAGALSAIYLHLTSAPAIAAVNLAAVLSAVGRGRLLDPRALARFLAVNAAIGVLCLPLLPTLLSPVVAAQSLWMPAITRWTLQTMVGTMLAGPAIGAPQAMRAAEILLPLLAALMLLPPWRPDRRTLTVLVLVPALFIAIMAISTALGRKVLLDRTLAWLLIPLCVVLGDVLARRPKPLAAIVVAAFAAAAAFHLARIDRVREDWRGFLARLPDLSPPALLVLAPHTSPAAVALYAPDAPRPVRLDDGAPPGPETDVIPRILGTPTITLEAVQDAIRQRRPVWLIYRRPEYEWMLKATAALPPPRFAVQDMEGSNPGIRALRW